MFLKFLQCNRQFIRSSRNIMNDKGASSTSSQTNKPNKTTFDQRTFPYVFGGAMFEQKIVQINKILLSTIKLSAFKESYSNLLESIDEKKINKLSQLVEPLMVDPLMKPPAPLKLINKGSTIHTTVTRLQYGLGVKFERNRGQQYRTMIDQPQIHVYMNSTPTQEIFGNSGKIPIVVSYQTVMASKMKLILSGNEETQTIEQHRILFEQENFIDIQDMMKLYSGAINFDKVMEIKKLLSSENPWKIGNIDSFLIHRVQK